MWQVMNEKSIPDVVLEKFLLLCYDFQISILFYFDFLPF